ncbi:MAG: DUF2007 domain-containing protein [Bacteroidaceae bacterium]|nr:DUF2007 domain-containing protein [Bacteroidaceae bacterium]MBR5729153.1 DUF2007 domain-containing protein [Prevotella sp.]
MANEEKFVVVKTCNELFEAELVAGRLRAEGIEAFLRDRTGIAAYSSPYAFPCIIEVEVLEHDLAAAEAILAETDTNEE